MKRRDQFKKTSEVLSAVLEAVEVLGPNVTTDVLRRASRRNRYSDPANKDKGIQIIRICMSHFSLTEAEFVSKDNRGNPRLAMKIAVTLMQEILDLSYAEIAECIDRDSSNISRYLLEMNKLNPSLRPDALIIQHMEEIRNSDKMKALISKLKPKANGKKEE